MSGWSFAGTAGEVKALFSYPFADARGALRAIAHRQAKGKVVLSRQA